MNPEDLEVGKTYQDCDSLKSRYTYVGKDELYGWVFRKEDRGGTAYRYVNFHTFDVSWLNPVPEPFFEPGKRYRHKWCHDVVFTPTDIVTHPDNGRRWARGWELDDDGSYKYPGYYANFENWDEV